MCSKADKNKHVERSILTYFCLQHVRLFQCSKEKFFNVQHKLLFLLLEKYVPNFYTFIYLWICL